MKPFAYTRARNQQAAVQTIAQLQNAKFIAGGTNLIQALLSARVACAWERWRGTAIQQTIASCANDIRLFLKRFSPGRVPNSGMRRPMAAI